MSKRMDYVERFMMHTELYMLLTGKHAHDLTLTDIDRISGHIDLMQQQEAAPASANVMQDVLVASEHVAI